MSQPIQKFWVGCLVFSVGRLAAGVFAQVGLSLGRRWADLVLGFMAPVQGPGSIWAAWILGLQRLTRCRS